MNIMQVVASNSSLSTFINAVKAAGLVGLLSGTEPFTLFVPRDEAFAKLRKGAVAYLVKPENKTKLAALIKMHVLSGKHMVANFAGKVTDFATLGGTKVAIKRKDGHILIDAATITTADLVASNGVIHLIDTVLAPALMPAK